MYIIDVSTDEEYNEVIKDVEEHNKKSRELWEEAVKKSELEKLNFINDKLSNRLSLADPLSSAGEYSTTSTGTYSSITGSRSYVTSSGYRAYLKTMLAYYKVPYSSTYTFGHISAVNLYGSDEGLYVEKPKTQKKLDGGRTLAVSFEYTIGVKNSWGVIKYITRNDYVEFNTNGTGVFY